MKNHLETILVGAILEFTDSEMDSAPKCLHAAMSVFLEHESVFEKIPKQVVKSSEDLAKIDSISMTGLEKDLLTNHGKENDKEIQYFKKKGVLIYDGIRASAFGRMNYFYRSKGIRIYLLEDSKIMTVSPYSYINHDGFSFVQEEVDSVNFEKLKTEEQIQDLLVYTKEDINIEGNININEQLMKMLISIKKPFRRDYYLEYLLTPPDVDKLSDFSEKVKQEFWNICLSKSFKKYWGKDMQKNAISFLSYMRIPPTPIQILDFIKSKSKTKKIYNILEDIELLKNHLMNQKEDILECKPNIAGFGINLNEMKKIFIKKFYQ